jgi:hypothetical protein
MFLVSTRSDLLRLNLSASLDLAMIDLHGLDGLCSMARSRGTLRGCQMPADIAPSEEAWTKSD